MTVLARLVHPVAAAVMAATGAALIAYARHLQKENTHA